MDLNNILTLLEITVAASIFYVWVVRYENIVTEFKEYNYPDWFRDTIGILKLILVSTLVTQTEPLYQYALYGMILLMGSAVLSHVKVKHQMHKAVPSMVILSICLFLGFN